MSEYFGIEFYEEYISEDGGRLIKKESVMDQQKLENVKAVGQGTASAEDHAEVGRNVAELKTGLHEAEQSVTSLKMHEVDWAGLYKKAKTLFALIEKLAGKDAAAQSSPSTHPEGVDTPAHTQSQPQAHPQRKHTR